VFDSHCESRMLSSKCPNFRFRNVARLTVNYYDDDGASLFSKFKINWKSSGLTD
jgi:hypothetical protein